MPPKEERGPGSPPQNPARNQEAKLDAEPSNSESGAESTPEPMAEYYSRPLWVELDRLVRDHGWDIGRAIVGLDRVEEIPENVAVSGFNILDSSVTHVRSDLGLSMQSNIATGVV